MANLQSQIDILAKAVVREHIILEEFINGSGNRNGVTLNEVTSSIAQYDTSGAATI